MWSTVCDPDTDLGEAFSTRLTLYPRSWEACMCHDSGTCQGLVRIVKRHSKPKGLPLVPACVAVGGGHVARGRSAAGKILRYIHT